MTDHRINFKKQFVGLILDGDKTTTFRKPRQRPIRASDTLTLIKGSRYKPETFARADVIDVTEYYLYFKSGTIRRTPDFPTLYIRPKCNDELARNDGFVDFAAFLDFMRETYKRDVDMGIIGIALVKIRFKLWEE